MTTPASPDGGNDAAAVDPGGRDTADHGGATGAEVEPETGAAGGGPNGGAAGTGRAAATGGVAPTGGAAGTSSAAGTSGVAGTDEAGTAGSSGSAGAPAPITKFVGNITFREQVDAEGLTFSDHWDQITPENAGTWGAVQSQANAGFNWSALDAIYDYTEDSGIAFKQHSFVWGSQQPRGEISPADVQNWMESFCKRYPHTRVIDVVNEPPPHTNPAYADAIGGGTDSSWQWIANAFIWARAACPDAVLLLNDYNIIENDDENARVIDIVRSIQDAGAPIDAVGAEGCDAAKLPIATVKAYMDEINTQTGLPLYITEYLVTSADDDEQLRIYQEQFPVFFDTQYVHGITIWGWIYNPVWSVDVDSYLVRNGAPRPAMTWLMQRLERPVP